MKKAFKFVLFGIGGFILLMIVISFMGGDEKSASTNPEESTASQGVAAEETKSASNWTYSEKEDKMSSTATYFAEIQADEKLDFKFPYHGGSTAKIILRKGAEGTDVIFNISKGQIVTGNMVEGGTTKVKFDDEKPFSVDVTYPSDHSSDYIFLGSEKKLISKFKTSKKFLIEVEFFNEGIRQIEFNTEGLNWSH